MKDSFIKKIINLLESSDLDSIQISSFWGMSKIKLFKSSSAQNSPSTINPKVEKENKNHPSLDISSKETTKKSFNPPLKNDSQRSS